MSDEAALMEQIVAFLHAIGIAVQFEPLTTETFLPGITIRQGALVIDPAQLKYPGDLLHEAGHPAVVPAARRRDLKWNVGKSAGEELMAIAWSYAAAAHLNLDPAVVFHPHGYRGGGQTLIDNFRQGRHIGVPTLQWIGLTYERKQAVAANVPPYPHMIKWLRD